MKKLLARALALLLTLAVAAPAPAQLLPTGSLIVSITSPNQGATVKGTIPVSASVSIVGSLTVSRVDFYVDGNFIGSDSTASYSVSWDTRKIGNGSHTLTAVAQDVLGVRWTSSGVSVTVANDTTRPTVTITQAAGQADPTSASPINFTVVFSEPVSGFTGSDVAISGTAGGTKSVSVTGGPSTYNAAVGGMTSSGTVSATVGAGAAQDAAGNTNTASTSTDNTVTFTLPDATAPAVSITSPANGATVSGTIDITASASDNVGVAGVQFKVNGANVGAEDTAAPYSLTVDTKAVADGSYTLTAVAHDAAGNSTVSSPIIVTVSNAPPADTTAPTVSITSPTNGATVSGTITVTASASDDVGVASVQFRLDGVNAGAPNTSAPYSIPWDTTSVSDGSHIITAIAADAAGNQTTSAPVTVTVSNAPPADTTPPSVSISSPADGATVSGTINVTASASDNVGVTSVQFRLDGADAGPPDTSAPYSIPWDTTTAADGTHTISAVARDAAGNQTTSAPVTVAVSNAPPADTIPPSVSITSPAGGATVSGTITVSASASDNVGVAGVQFQLDGVNAGPVLTAAPYELPWDTTGASDGTHTLTAIAADAAGNQATSAPVTVTVSNAPPADTTPPAVSVSSPAEGATVSGTITVSASASDDVGVAGVQFLLDGVSLGAEDTSAPYSIAWDTTAASDGEHVLSTRARDAAGNETTSATVGVTVTNGGAPAATRFEEDHPAVNSAPAGAWARIGPEIAAFSGGTAGAANAAGANVTFTFSGTGVSWLGLKCNACGIASVSVDGGAPVPVDTAGPGAPDGSLAAEAVFSASGLDPTASHTLTITVTGETSSSNSYIVVDAFDVTGGSGSAVTRIEETGPGVSAAGAWALRGAETAEFSGGAAGSSDAAGSTLTLDFTGTAVSWIGLRCNACGIATVSIDGGEANAVDTAGPTAPGSPGLASEPVFSALGLAAGSHRLVITVTGETSTGGAHVIVDAFDVTP